MLLKTNITAVAILIISGVLMAIDETNVLAIWNNIQAWTVFIIIKVIGTLIMMILGFYQTYRALGKRNHVKQSNSIYRTYYRHYFNFCRCDDESN